MGQRIRANAQGLNQNRAASPLLWGLVITAVIVILGIGWWVWRSPEQAKQSLQSLQSNIQSLTGQEANTPSPSVEHDTPPTDTPEITSEQAHVDPLALEDEEPLNPIEAPEELASEPLPSLESSDKSIGNALSAWGATQQARALIRNEQFIRRFVTTIDNLTTPRAPSALWPIYPTEPKFTVEDQNGGVETQIAQANSARYTLAVQFVQNLNVTQAARDYRHFYPLFQQAYEDLGYPNRYFNDRLIAVIDHLLQAPEPIAPRVHLMKVRGQIASEQPWVRYEFEDLQLEALSAGQKILVRMGPDHARAVKAKLRAFRDAIASAPAPHSTPTSSPTLTPASN
ncbi:DUF3014 domain-containing protein [Lampropedia puyangensis]|uniref:DUF3014 domain-containing protein n=1 Tax=Lampropedia puyangensis TaxID=1330072 RepID=A0A4S8F131_9BURK|nr:DUF3014 domain-containing protein [Lampropedia puyangensis]THU00657.1 DUF3014 domain-containing protein [Lampropedia puyangensis]